MVTIRDVARAAGVSIATVSRALADPARVAESTRTRVNEACDQLGYTPNRAASGLRARRTNTIGLLVPDLSNPYFSTLSRGVASVARSQRHRMGVFVSDSQEDPAAEPELLEGLLQQTDGIVLAAPRSIDESYPRLREKPLVLVNYRVEGVPCVTVDDVLGMRDAIDHLYDLGHRRVVYVGGPSTSWTDKNRREGAARASAEHDDLELVQVGAFAPTVDGGHEAAGVALATSATAVVAFNDFQAIGIVRRFQALGLRVPHDVSVVGHDDTYLAALVAPALTTVHGETEEVGERSTELLIELLGASRERSLDHVLRLPPRLVVRDSTAPPPAFLAAPRPG